MVAERASVASRVTPSASMVTVTSRASSVPLRTSVRSVTSSPTRRKRGSAGRTMSGCVTSSSLSPSPTCVAAVVARASARHVVVLSGRRSSKPAVPSSSVVSCPIQSAVLRKSERTRGPDRLLRKPPSCRRIQPHPPLSQPSASSLSADSASAGALARGPATLAFLARFSVAVRLVPTVDLDRQRRGGVHAEYALEPERLHPVEPALERQREHGLVDDGDRDVRSQRRPPPRP